MSTRQQAAFWLALAVVLIILLSVLRDILLPFVLGTTIAYFLDPIADRLERFGMSRLMATVVISLISAMVLVTVVLGLVPLLIKQLAAFAASLPQLLQQLREFGSHIAETWLSGFGKDLDLGIDAPVQQIAEKVPSLLQGLLVSIWSGGMAFANFLALFLVTPVVAFYLLKGWDRMIAAVDGWLPRQHAPTVRLLAREIDNVVSGFVRGQGTVLLLLVVIYVIGLSMAGLNYALLIGLGSGLVSFIPYVGPIVGFVVGGTVAGLQFWPDWGPIALVLAVFTFGQVIEGNVLSPLIVGDRVNLHPVWLILALFVFGYLFGLVGLLLAVPIAAAIGVLIRFALGVYLKSDFYRGPIVAAKPQAGKAKTATTPPQ